MNDELNRFSSENACLITCPYCNSQMDYGKVAANMHRGEESVEACLVCKHFIRLTGLDGALKVEKM